MGEYRTLSLSQLKVNPQNPRYRNPQTGEAEAILALFKEIKSKPEMALRHMLNLIDDIVKHGTNPADLPIVVPDPDESDKYQVMEGNRRIASLKLLYFPELAAEVFQAEPRVLKRLEEFRKDFLAQFQEQYKKVLCVVFSTPKDANHWIYLRHTGENEGRGITPWDKMAKRPFSATNFGAQTHHCDTNSGNIGRKGVYQIRFACRIKYSRTHGERSRRGCSIAYSD